MKKSFNMKYNEKTNKSKKASFFKSILSKNSESSPISLRSYSNLNVDSNSNVRRIGMNSLNRKKSADSRNPIYEEIVIENENESLDSLKFDKENNLDEANNDTRSKFFYTENEIEPPQSNSNPKSTIFMKENKFFTENNNKTVSIKYDTLDFAINPGNTELEAVNNGTINEGFQDDEPVKDEAISSDFRKSSFLSLESFKQPKEEKKHKKKSQVARKASRASKLSGPKVSKIDETEIKRRTMLDVVTQFNQPDNGNSASHDDRFKFGSNSIFNGTPSKKNLYNTNEMKFANSAQQAAENQASAHAK